MLAEILIDTHDHVAVYGVLVPAAHEHQYREAMDALAEAEEEERILAAITSN